MQDTHLWVISHWIYLIVLDFGGHAMRAFDRGLKQGCSNWPRFFSPDDSDLGARGGDELWELLTGHGLDEARKTRGGEQRFPDKDWHLVQAALLKQLFSERRLIIELDEILDPSSVKAETTYNSPPARRSGLECLERIVPRLG